MKKAVGTILASVVASLVAFPLFAASPGIICKRLTANGSARNHQRISVRNSTGKVPASWKVQPRPNQVNCADVSGVSIELPVVGRLTGNGGTIFKTSLDVSNFTSAPTPVCFDFEGVDVATQAPVSAVGTFVNDSTNTFQLGFSNIHFDDMIDTIVSHGGGITPQEENDGVLGSILIVTGIDPSAAPAGVEQAEAKARFYSSNFGGTIGETLAGHTITGDETTETIGTFYDTRGEAGVPQLYANIFLNNMGFYDSSSGVLFQSDDTVTLTAYSNTTGLAVGTPLTVSVPSFQTAVVGDIFTAMNIPLSEDTVLVVAKVTSGNGDLLGVGAQIDNGTKDPSGFNMSPTNF